MINAKYKFSNEKKSFNEKKKKTKIEYPTGEYANVLYHFQCKHICFVIHEICFLLLSSFAISLAVDHGRLWPLYNLYATHIIKFIAFIHRITEHRFCRSAMYAFWVKEKKKNWKLHRFSFRRKCSLKIAIFFSSEHILQIGGAIYSLACLDCGSWNVLS